MTQLEKFYQDTIDKGGEGVILRDPDAKFQAGRDPGYLKHKASNPSLTKRDADTNSRLQKFRDAEARVIGSVSAWGWECEL